MNRWFISTGFQVRREASVTRGRNGVFLYSIPEGLSPDSKFARGLRDVPPGHGQSLLDELSLKFSEPDTLLRDVDPEISAFADLELGREFLEAELGGSDFVCFAQEDRPLQEVR